MKALLAVSMSLAIVLALGPPGRADEPVVAGENGVTAPKKTKTVLPEYPPEAQARGQRGIVIVELVIDPQGKVSSARIIRSIPPFDEAALSAVRQWEYEVTRVGGKPVSVKLTVPITFAMKIPEIGSRQEGIPELRAGAFPPLPADARETATATAEITLGAEGNVEELRIVDGSPAYADSLARALRTWRFSAEASEATVTFLVHAQFNPSAKPPAPRVEFRLDGLRRSESLATADAGGAAPAAATTPTAPPAIAAPEPAAQSPTTTPPVSAPAPPPPVVSSPTSHSPGGGAGAGSPAAPPPAQAPPPKPVGAGPTPPSTATVGPPPVTAPAPPAAASYPAPASGPATVDTNAPHAVPPPRTAAAGPPPAQAPSTALPQAPAPSAKPAAVEVLSVSPPAEPPENGLSAIRDVTLLPGVPDLTRGRRPVPPPFARMAQATGAFAVTFSVDAAGISSVKGSSGPEIFKRASEQAVSSWTFRRTRAERIFLVAEFKFTADAASATVHPDVK